MSLIPASTYNFIATQTLNGTSTSVTFNNIPQTYTDLVVVTNLIGTTGGNSAAFAYNNDLTGSNYSFAFITGNGSSANSYVYSNQATQPTLIDTVFGSNVSHIMNYTNTTTYKTYISRANIPDNQMRLVVGTWRNTSAINSLTLFPTPNAYSFASGSTFTLYGIKAADVAPITPTKAIGGDQIVSDGTYTYHVFKSSGSFYTSPALTADVLVVAGGGSGGTNQGGGGGAGGVLAFASQSLTASTAYTVTVGAGGAAVSSASAPGISGNSSQFGAITPASAGGGNGGSYSYAPGSGGSGGGAGSGSYTSGGSASPSGQGNGGGSTGWYGAGGGGAGGIGGSTSASNNLVTGSGGPGPGGLGVNTVTNWGTLSTALNLINIGSNGYIAGGGGGGSTGSNAGGAPGAGGSGVGGNGQAQNYNFPATAGSPNTGSGGGGGNQGGNGYNPLSGAGASGIVIVRYAS